MTTTPTAKRAALYVRVSTADRGQTVENQLRPLQEAAARLGWAIVAVHRDEGISGAKGRAQRPGLDALLRGVTRREFDIVAAWSVCRLGRSLPDLIGLLGELQARGVDLYQPVDKIGRRAQRHKILTPKLLRNPLFRVTRDAAAFCQRADNGASGSVA